MSRRLEALLVAVALALGSAACGDSEPASADSIPVFEGGTAGETSVDPPAEDGGLDVAVDAPGERSQDDGGPTESGLLDSGSEAEASICSGTGPRYVTRVVEHQFGPGQDTGQADLPVPVLGPPRGASAPGVCQGSLHVVSLGNGGQIVLAFDGNAIIDGPGADFIVFENAFHVGCDPNEIFAELGTVAVSEDGEQWVEFPCTATAPPYGACSGWHPVYANAETNDIDPTDPAVAGGDAYDLAEIGVGMARYVRITDRADLTGTSGVYDLDAVAIVNPLCP